MTERRYDPLSDRWVIVSPGRVSRPWQGEVGPAPATEPEWREDCYLCPRTSRAGGAVNPDYRGIHVFDNDFPALAADPAASESAAGGLLQRMPVTGRCRVLCYDHRHDRTLADLAHDELLTVIATWQQETETLAADHAWVQAFENKGRMMGCSSDHPHGQIWASDHLPSLPAVEDRRQADHLAAHGRPLLLDYADHEVDHGERVVACNGRWVALVPYWAAWPFEVLLVPRRRIDGFTALDAAGGNDLAEVLGTLLRAYDRLFGVSMPYSMGWHGRMPALGDHWQLHAHFYPPLLRSATVRKFMVGYEMLAEAQRDLTPEAAAARLRALT